MRGTPPSGGRRLRRISLRWLPGALSFCTCLAVLILAAWLLYYSVESPYFEIREFTVSGARLLDPAQVGETSGILGRNALLVRGEDVEQSVLRLTPAREAHAVITLAGRVAIDIAERTPLAQWKGREGSFLVDREGVLFSTATPSGPVISVRDLDGPAAELGGRVDPGVLATVELLEAALPVRAGIRPQGYEYSRSSGVAVPVQDGPRILFGDSADLDSKIAALVAIKEHLEASKSRAEVIDLRFKSRPTYVIAPPTPIPTRSSQAR